MLYQVGQIDQLATQLNAVLANPAEQARLGANARELTRRLFDVRAMVQNIEAVYEELWAPAAGRVVTLRPSKAQSRAA